MIQYLWVINCVYVVYGVLILNIYLIITFSLSVCGAETRSAVLLKRSFERRVRSQATWNSGDNQSGKVTDHPQLGILSSSDTPNDMEPMKSLRVVRSQSHTSTDRRRSLSEAFSLLHAHTKGRKKQHVTYRGLFLNSSGWLRTVKKNLSETQRTQQRTHKVKDSFQQGLREERMVLVFCLVSFLGSGVSLSLT